jgi:flagellar hook-associated protein 1 FlgK
MSTGLFSIGVSGLSAAQLGLSVTEHNVTNASTPGYTRQRTVQATNIAVNTGAGALGQGVHVQTIERMYDRFLTAQVNSAQTTLSGIDAYYAEVSQIDNLLADPSAGLSPALQDFFSAVQNLTGDRAGVPSRGALLSTADTLAARFQAMNGRLDEIRNRCMTGTNEQAAQQARTRFTR